MKPHIGLRISNVFGYIVLIAVNIAASKGWLGPTNEKLSKKNHTPITPAGWAFSIWGIIFLLQGLAVIYQALDHGYENDAKAQIVEAISYFWILGWTAECAWQLFFQWQTRAGMWICMFCLLLGLASFAIALSNIYSLQAEKGPFPPLLYALYALPTSVNTAWLSVASCIGILIVANQHSLPHPELGAVLLAALATVMGFVLMLAHHDTAYGVVLIWALCAVYAKQERIPVGYAALACIIVSMVGVGLSLLHWRPSVNRWGGYLEL